MQTITERDVHVEVEIGSLVDNIKADTRQFDKSMRTHIRRVRDRKSTRLNSSHLVISYAVFCLKKKKMTHINRKVIDTGVSRNSKPHCSGTKLANAIHSVVSSCDSVRC